ncbi:MAG: M48 family metallopeptidase [Actinomycetes bacterium]
MTASFPVEIVRSTKRRKTAQAVLVDGVIRVLVPSRLSAREVDDLVRDLVPRLERKYRSDHIDLSLRAAELARRFNLPLPNSIVWADNQRKRWGSCDTRTGDIRMSSRLADYPPWVLDYVLVHELTHLVIRDHSPEFRSLVDRYPRAERARGYLMATNDLPDSPHRSSAADGLDDDLEDFEDFEDFATVHDEPDVDHVSVGLTPPDQQMFPM